MTRIAGMIAPKLRGGVALLAALALMMTLSLTACSHATATTDSVVMFGKSYQVETGKPVVVEVKVTGCDTWSKTDGTINHDTVKRIVGTSASLETLTDLYKKKKVKKYPDAKFKVLSIDAKAAQGGTLKPEF